MTINKSTCPRTEESFRKGKWDESGRDLEKKWYADPIAAVSYWTHHDHPVQEEETQRTTA